MQALTKEYLADLFFSFTEAKSTDELWDALMAFYERYELKHVRTTIFDAEDPVAQETWRYKRAYPEGKGSWGDHYADTEMYKHDRSFKLLFQYGIEVLEWTKMQELTRKGSAASRVFEEMLDYGIGDGILVGKSCRLCNHTVLTGLAGPSRSFKVLKKQKDAYRSLLYCLRAWNGCFLELAIQEDALLETRKQAVYRFNQRDLEILQELSLGQTAETTGETLNISRHAVDTAIRRLKNNPAIPTNGTRDGIVAYAVRTRQIQ